MVHRVINDIDIPNFVWQKVKPLKQIYRNLAFDTETEEGRIFLISNSDKETVNDYNNFQREGEPEPESPLLGLLIYLNNRRYTKSVNWFYNLQYDTNALLKYLSFDDRKHIAYYNVVDVEGYRIQIIPNKELKISKLDKDDKPVKPTFFYDLAQFYDFKPLKKLAEQTNYSKVYVNDISQVNIQKYYNDKEYFNLWNERCVVDCLITVEIADKLTMIIQQIVNVNKYKSKASIARRYVLENMNHNLKMPNIHVLDSALQAFHAGHIEACKIGDFKNIHNYDLNSAYPAYIAELYETNTGYLHNREYEPDTAYSFYLVDVEYYDDNLSPIWFFKSQANYHINGKCEVWITQMEIEYLQNNGYPVTILQAYHIKKNRFTEKPFEFLVKDLYKMRLEAKERGDEIQLVLKVILNSIFGVTLNAVQKRDISDLPTDLFEIIGGKLVYYENKYLAGNMYNPVYGCYITANVRTQLFTDFKNYLPKILSVNTDGVYLTHNVNVPTNKELGGYSHKKIDRLMIMGSGRYFVKDKLGIIDNVESKFRGIPLAPVDIEKKMVENKDSNYIELTKEKPIKLKESVRIPAYKDKFNTFQEVKKQVYFKTDRRYWYNEINNISDLWDKQIDSRPFDIQELR